MRLSNGCRFAAVLQVNASLTVATRTRGSQKGATKQAVATAVEEVAVALRGTPGVVSQSRNSH